MRRSPLSLALLALALAGDSAAEDDPDAAPPPREAPSKPDLSMIRRWLEAKAKEHSWPMNFQEDEVLAVGGTSDPKATQACFALCKGAIERFCRIFKTTPEQLRGERKFCFIHLARKPEYMAFAADQAKQQDNPKITELLDTIPGSGFVVCLDPSYGTTPESIQHLTVHLLGHRLMERLAKLHGCERVPGWLAEGIPSYLDGCLNQSPHACCVAKGGYDDDRYNTRKIGGTGWEGAVHQTVKTHTDLKGKDREKSPFTGLVRMTALPLDKLSGPDVAVSWRLIRDLHESKKKPDAFRTFVEATLDGKKQQDAFQEAFGKSMDEYEKSWTKGILDAPPAGDKPKR